MNRYLTFVFTLFLTSLSAQPQPVYNYIGDAVFCQDNQSLIDYTIEFPQFTLIEDLGFVPPFFEHDVEVVNGNQLHFTDILDNYNFPSVIQFTADGAPYHFQYIDLLNDGIIAPVNDDGTLQAFLSQQDIVSCSLETELTSLATYCLDCDYHWTVDGIQTNDVTFTEGLIEVLDIGVPWSYKVFSDISVSFEDVGVHEVCLVASADVCSINAFCFEVTVFPMDVEPQFEVVGDETDICRNQDICFANTTENAIELESSGDFAWSIIDDMTGLTVFSAVSLDLNFQFNQPGQFTVELAYFNDECASPDVATTGITVSNNPRIEITCPSVVCEGAIATYVPQIPNGDCSIFTWEVLGPSGTTQTQNADGSLTVEWGSNLSEYEVGYVSLTGDENACSNYCFPSVVDVPIFPLSTSIHGPDLICEDGLIEYYVPDIPGSFYSWSVVVSNSSGASTVNVFTQTSNELLLNTNSFPHGDVMVTVVIENPYIDCELTSSITVSYPEISGNQEICLGSTFSVDVDFYSELTVGYQIVDNEGNIVANNPSHNTNNSIAYTPVEEGIYYLDLFLNNAECDNQIELSAVVSNSPFIFGEISVCPNTPYTYTANSADNEVIEWVINGDYTNPTFGSEISVVWQFTSPVNSLEARKILTLPSGEICTSAWYLFTPVFEMPTFEIEGDMVVCYDGVSSFNLVSSDIEIDDIDWTIVLPEIGSVVSGQGSESVVIQWYIDENIQDAIVVAEVLYCGQVTSVSQGVIFQQPQIAISEDTEICKNETSEISILQPNSSALVEVYTNITWEVNNVVQPEFEGLNSIVFEGSDVGVFTIEATVIDADGCSGMITESMQITVKDVPPNVVISQSFVGVCPVSNVTNWAVSIVNFDPTNSYTAFLNGVPLNIIGSTIDLGLMVPTEELPPTMILSISVSSGGCTIDGGINLSWVCDDVSGCCTEVPNLDISSIKFQSCDQVEFTGSTSDFDATRNTTWSVIYDFQGVNATTLDGFPRQIDQPIQFIDQVAILDQGPGEYTVLLGDECISPENCDAVFVELETITLPFVKDFEYYFKCQSNQQYSLVLLDRTELAPEITTNELSFDWFLNGTQVNSTSAQTFTVPNLTPGDQIEISLDVDFLAFDPYNFICSEISKTIDIPDLPTASFEVEDEFNCRNQVLTFTADPNLGNNTIVESLWDFGDGVNSRRNPVQKVFSQEGTYNIALTVTDQYGCTASSSTNFQVSNTSVSGTLSFSAMGTCGSMVELIFTPEANQLAIVEHLWSTGESTGTTPYVMINQSGIYGVTVLDENGCPTHFESIVVSLADAFAQRIKVSGSECGNKKIQYILNQGYSSLQYIEYPDGTISCDNSTLFEDSGTYTVTVYAFDTPVDCTSPPDLSTACSYDEVTFVVNEIPIDPMVSIGELDCQSGGVSIHIENSIDIYETLIYGDFLPPMSNVDVATVFSNGTYFIRFTDPASDCFTEMAVEVDNLPPDFSGMLTGCYTICTDDQLLISGMISPPVERVNAGAWEWRVDGSAVSSGTGSGVIQNLSLASLNLVEGSEYEITFVYLVDECEFESEALCLFIDPCPAGPDCIVYPDGQACGSNPIECVVSESDGGPTYFMTMDYYIPNGSEFGPEYNGVELSYCLPPTIVSNGSIIVHMEDQYAADRVKIVASFTVDDPSTWSASNPIEVQITYCGDDGNVYCVKYQINAQACLPDPLECQIYYSAQRQASYDPRTGKGTIAVEYCAVLYNVDHNGCESTDWTITPIIRDIYGNETPIQSEVEVVVIPSNDAVMLHCFELEFPDDFDLSTMPYLGFNMVSNCPGIGCFHEFYYFANESNSYSPLSASNTSEGGLGSVFPFSENNFNEIDFDTRTFETHPIKVYPNPSQGHFYIQASDQMNLDNLVISVVDLQGKEMNFESERLGIFDMSIRFDISGVYVLKYTERDSGKSRIIKLVLAR